MEDINLDFNGLYNKRPEPKSRPKKVSKKAKRKVIKKQKRKRSTRRWDNSLSNLEQHKLSPSRQLTKKLNAVSKHRHYAKDLVQEQKRKAMEQRRLALEEKEIEQEQKQLIRRKQLLLRRHKIPHLKPTFPVFTSGRTESSDSEIENDPQCLDEDELETESNESNEFNESNESETEMTLKALSNKLTTLEDELETMKRQKKRMKNMKIENENKEQVVEKENIEPNIDNDENDENDENDINECDLTLDYESIEKTIKAATKHTQISKQKIVTKPATKPLHIKLPDMPNVPNIRNINTNQPPQLSQAPQSIQQNDDEKEEKKINAALNSLDVPSLLMILDKLKIYFKEMQAEKKQNEEFRTTLLESVNAQNTQILHLLSSLASQQKQVDNLTVEVSTLRSKLQKYENSNVTTVANVNNDKPQWIKNNDITSLKDIKNVIEESRPSSNKMPNNNNTDWKSISNVLKPKNVSNIKYSGVPQQAYTIEKYQHEPKKRSFIPFISEEAMERSAVCPPHPVPKPIKKKQVNNNDYNNDYVMTNYPNVRIERHCK